MLMSLQSSSFFIMVMCLMSALLLKWKKSMMTIVLMEGLSMLALASILFMPGGKSMLIILLIPFFVSEALILVTSFYTALRVSGSSFSVITLH